MKKFTTTGSNQNAKPARTGFRIVVHESVSRFPVSNTRITFFPGGRSVITKLKGMVIIELEAGEYQYLVKSPGYPPIEGVATAIMNIIQLLYIKMEKATDIKTANKSVTS